MTEGRTRFGAGTAYRTPQHLRIMEDAGLMLFELFERLKDSFSPDSCGTFVEQRCLDYFRQKGMKTALRGYRGFPAAVCVSVNEVAAHGVPDSRRFRDGDVVTLDVAVEYRGFFADSAWTYQVGSPTQSSRNLILAAWRSCTAAVAAASVLRTISGMGRAAHDAAALAGAMVLPQFGGHGIGRSLHEAPRFAFIPVVQEPDEIPMGAVINIEPVVCLGNEVPKIAERGPAFVAETSRWCAQFEQSLAFTESGARVITLPDPAILRLPQPPF